MRLQEIIFLLREYFFLAFLAVIFLAASFFFGYYFVYKRLLRGERRISFKKILLWGIFIGYLIMVLGVTFFNRGSNYPSSINLSFLSSYREAWNNFSVRHWQFVILNILMFVPFGFLLPLIHSRFLKPFWTIGAATLFTFFIEIFQAFTGLGIFEIDDLFNNILGSVIGYGLIMSINTLKHKNYKKTLLYFTPLLTIVLSFSGIFIYYFKIKEFGNLPIAAIYQANVTRAEIAIDVELNDHRITVPIYKAPRYTKDEAGQFAKDFFQRLGLESVNMEVDSYPDESVYWINGENTYNIWFQLIDGSYRYNDYSMFDENFVPKDIDEGKLRETLTKFAINIPDDADFKKVEIGTFEWIVDKKAIADQLIDGNVIVAYYSDDTIKRIDNNLITYNKVKDIQIKSEQEAYEEILDGKFPYYGDKQIHTLHIHKVDLSYHLDSKGFYQPVYAFYSTVNGTDFTILIPGI